MEVLSAFLTTQVIVTALILNFVMAWVKEITLKLTKGKKFMFYNQLMMTVLFVMAFALTFLGLKLGWLTAITDMTPFVMAGGIAIVSLVFYNVGVKGLIQIIRAFVLNKLNIKQVSEGESDASNEKPE